MDAVERFAALVAGAEPDLDVGALAIAAGAHPGLTPDRWLAELDRMAVGVVGVDGLLDRLVGDEGFTGNSADYYDPRNSLLPHVLVRRTGIPITLAVVAIEVGRRAGVALEGVGMPGHFLVREPGSEIHIDMFGGGHRLDAAACEALFRSTTGAGPQVRFGPEQLPRTPNRAILVRMLENLRVIYRHRQRPADVEWVLRMRMAVPGATDPTAGLVVELATVLGEQARWTEGARMLREAADDARSALSPGQRDTLRLAARSQLANLN
jgi:regulator of sirC expression with transglutaminase-like and TPR domain